MYIQIIILRVRVGSQKRGSNLHKNIGDSDHDYRARVGHNGGRGDFTWNYVEKKTFKNLF